MSRLCSTIHLAVNGFGTLLCLSAIIAFWALGNLNAVVWCWIAFVLAAANTFIQGVHYVNKLEAWYTVKSIAVIRDFGMSVGIIIAGFFFFTLFEIVYYHHSFSTPVKDSKIIVAVWCFVSAKYAFTLFWFGRKYMHHLSETRSALMDDE